MKNDIQNLLQKYCGYKRLRLQRVNESSYIISKYSLPLVSLSLNNDQVNLNYGETVEQKSLEDFVDYIQKEIKHEKLLARFLRTAKPRKQFKRVRMRITEHGIDYIKNYAFKQNERGSEQISIEHWNSKRRV